MPKNPTYKRTPKQRQQDLKLIFQYRKEGKNWIEVRDLINGQRDYHCSFINYYHQYQREINKGLPDIDIEEEKRKQLAEIQLLKEELFSSWHMSKGVVKKTTTKGVASDKGDNEGLSRRERTVQEWREAGAAQYLATYVKLLEKESRLLGLDAAEKKEVNLTGNIIDWTE